jgi:hypothetical protein
MHGAINLSILHQQRPFFDVFILNRLDAKLCISDLYCNRRTIPKKSRMLLPRVNFFAKFHWDEHGLYRVSEIANILQMHHISRQWTRHRYCAAINPQIFDFRLVIIITKLTWDNIKRMEEKACKNMRESDENKVYNVLT